MNEKVSIVNRFISAADGNPPTEEQRASVAAVNEAVRALAIVLAVRVPDNRNRSVALTNLEDVQMRAVRAVFTGEDND